MPVFLKRVIKAWNKGAIGALHSKHITGGTGRMDYHTSYNDEPVCCLVGAGFTQKQRNVMGCDYQTAASFAGGDKLVFEEFRKLQSLHDSCLNDTDYYAFAFEGGSVLKTNRDKEEKLKRIAPELNRMAKKYGIECEAAPVELIQDAYKIPKS